MISLIDKTTKNKVLELRLKRVE